MQKIFARIRKEPDELSALQLCWCRALVQTLFGHATLIPKLLYLFYSRLSLFPLVPLWCKLFLLVSVSFCASVTRFYLCSDLIGHKRALNESRSTSRCVSRGTLRCLHLYFRNSNLSALRKPNYTSVQIYQRQELSLWCILCQGIIVVDTLDTPTRPSDSRPLISSAALYESSAENDNSKGAEQTLAFQCMLPVFLFDFMGRRVCFSPIQCC